MFPKPSKNLDWSRYKFAENFLKECTANGSSRTVFDIGAGDCRMRDPVEKNGFDWVGFDLFPASDQVVSWNLSEPCPLSEKKASIVLLLDVIEHLFNPGLALSNISRAMERGGLILITAPNPRWSRSRIHHLLKGELANFTEDDLNVNHHVFTPWRHVLRKALVDNGFAIRDYVTLDSKEAKIKSFLNPIALSEGLIRAILEKLDPGACGMSYALVARLENPEKRGKFVYSDTLTIEPD